MSKIIDEELNKVNGGFSIGALFGGPKFNIGDKVISKSDPDLGVGTIVRSQYREGWWYSVVMAGGMLYVPEADLESPIMQKIGVA